MEWGQGLNGSIDCIVAVLQRHGWWALLGGMWTFRRWEKYQDVRGHGGHGGSGYWKSFDSSIYFACLCEI